MNFCDELNNYINLLNCSAKDICKASGLSPTIVSRYLNGKRTPKIKSEYFSKIVDAIYIISQEKNIKLNKDKIFLTLSNSIESNNIDYNIFVTNFNRLFTDLTINTTDFAKSLGYDASFISKIKNKTRKPADIEGFLTNTSNYIINNYKSDEKKKLVASLLGCSYNCLDDVSIYKNNIINWLTSNYVKK